MKSKLQVFVSSTYLDLKDDRQAAVEAILKAGHIPAGMELFAAGDKSQWEVIQQWILDSDVYMLILGGRYGTVETKSGLSYTELEYDFAAKSGKPLFAVVIKEDALEDRIKKHGSHVFEKEYPAKLSAFRKKVLSKMSSFFSDHKDIKLAVHESLRNIETSKKHKGWVRHEEMPNADSLRKQLDTLKTENLKLRKQIDRQSQQAIKRNLSAVAVDRDFQILRDMMAAIKVDVSPIKGLRGIPNEDYEMSLLALVLIFKETLLRGINDAGMHLTIDKFDRFAFQMLCPQLVSYKLMQKGSGIRYSTQYTITQKGWAFFEYLEVNMLSDHEQEEPVEATTEDDSFPSISTEKGSDRPPIVIT
jgi:Domain of unknown function (DUF4062)